MKKIIWSVITFVSLCVLSVLVLTSVHLITDERITDNELKREASYMKSLIPESEGFTQLQEFELTERVEWVYAADNGEGYAVKSTADSNDSEIVVITGFDNSGDIIGIKILDKGDGSPYQGTLSFRDVYTKAMNNQYGASNRINALLAEISPDVYSPEDIIDAVSAAMRQVDIIISASGVN